ncbi:splicing factor PWI domain-containing protein [Iris pallida]|uniref:Splicing factor PWI domain-containing protein n=1 Tax=Iris pallida TaxID=29817 RepID=A0AAX6DIH8_IRIPA|nr:splicing factor PWI domain-containing protein [Iris pallida]
MAAQGFAFGGALRERRRLRQRRRRRWEPSSAMGEAPVATEREARREELPRHRRGGAGHSRRGGSCC